MYGCWQKVNEVVTVTMLLQMFVQMGCSHRSLHLVNVFMKGNNERLMLFPESRLIL